MIFAGLPDNFESEGYDRKHLNMPDCQNTLIEKVTEVQKNVIVVLHNGSPVLMPWKDKVKGIVEAYLGGQAVGRAVVNILYGKVNPSGRLPETFPARLEDTPLLSDIRKRRGSCGVSGRCVCRIPVLYICRQRSAVPLWVRAVSIPTLHTVT